MPDGDIVHDRLELLYQRPYKQMCEGQFGNGELAKGLVLSVWKEIRKEGDKLFPLFQETAQQCCRIQDKLLFEDIGWQQQFESIEELSRHISASKRMKTLAVNACKEQVRELSNGISSPNYRISILRKYMWNVCKASFIERLPLAPAFYKEVSLGYIMERLEMMRPFMDSRIYQYAELIDRYGTVRIPRQPPWYRNGGEVITEDTDISSIGL